MDQKAKLASLATSDASSASVASRTIVELEPAVQAVVSYRFGDSREPLAALADLVKASKSEPSKILAVEERFAAVLGSDATYECKDFICRQLWIIGKKASVPALASMLADETCSDMARYALERNPAPEAGKALRDALERVSGKVRIGIINTLGARRDRMSVLALERIAADTYEDAAAAAVSALAKIGGAKATSVISRARDVGSPKVKEAAALALRVMAGKPAPRARR